MPYQNPLSATKSLATVTSSVPICRIISRCLATGCNAKCSNRFPSRMPFVNGFPRSFLTVLYARGFSPAVCWAFLTSWSLTSWRRLKRADLTDTTVVSAPSEVAGVSVCSGVYDLPGLVNCCAACDGRAAQDSPVQLSRAQFSPAQPSSAQLKPTLPSKTYNI